MNSTVWLWQADAWKGGRDEFKVIDCAPTFDNILVYFGWCPTRSAAQKAIKKGEVKWRKLFEEWKTVQDWKQPPLQKYPFYIMFQNCYWKIREIMIPDLSCQGRRLWSMIWREEFPDGGPIKWRVAVWLDKMERLIMKCRGIFSGEVRRIGKSPGCKPDGPMVHVGSTPTLSTNTKV